MSSNTVKILAFETSCDDTSVAVLEGKLDEQMPRLLSLSVQSQNEVHESYGGVVPDLAARTHLLSLLPCLKKALAEAGTELSDIDVFCATGSPGLIGSLLVGHTAAKSLAMLFGKAFVSCNHLEGHLVSAYLENDPQFPHLSLVVSGGHTTLYRVNSWDDFEELGCTLDDAAGEAFDKGAKLLGLGFPGGPQLEKLAIGGSSALYTFPDVDTPNFHFSFSGLKSEMARLVKREGSNLQKSKAAHAYQEAIFRHLVKKIKKAADSFELRQLCLVGGVARNERLKQCLQELVSKNILERYYSPSAVLCTDNAAMIGAIAFRKYRSGQVSGLGVDVSSSFRPQSQKKRA